MARYLVKSNQGSFKKKFMTGVKILKQSFRTLKRYPILILPISICLILCSILTIYFSYYFNWNILSVKFCILLAFLLIFAFCIMYSVSSLFMLEIIQQIETNQKISLKNALYETFVKDFLRALPIILVWSIIWFILLVIKVLTRSKDDRYDRKPSLENFAKTLTNFNDISIFHLTIDLLIDGVRIAVFTIFPAIAWEDESPLNAVKKGFYTIKNNAVEFSSGFVQTELAIGFMLLPVCILILFVDKFEITLSQSVWVVTIIYSLAAITLYLYLQQMYTAILYMWNMKWVKAVQKAEEEGSKIPSIYSIKKPDLLDDVPDLL